MSMAPLGGVLGSAAGTPLSQTKGAATERAKQDAGAQERGVEADLKTERASGVGQTEGDQRSSDRDADGRRLWEAPPEKGGGDGDDPQGDAGEQAGQRPEGDAPDDAPGAPSDGTGGRLDLIG